MNNRRVSVQQLGMTAMAEMLSESAIAAKDQGNGFTGNQSLLKETDSALVGFGLDIFWLINAAYHPLTLFKENPSRFKNVACKGYG